MNAGKMLIGFAPWLLFSVMTHRLGEHASGIAAAAAAVAALALALHGRGRGGVKILDVVGVVTFAAIAVAAFTASPATVDWLSNFARGGSTLVLAAAMLVSAVTVPFTEQYARDTVDPRYWHRPEFRARNRRISAVWGGAVLLMAAGHLAAGVLDPITDPTAGTRPADLALNWVLPILLGLVAIEYTKKQSAAPTPDPSADAPA